MKTVNVKRQGLIFVLLALAIVFSIISIFVSLNSAGFNDLSVGDLSGKATFDVNLDEGNYSFPRYFSSFMMVASVVVLFLVILLEMSQYVKSSK